MSQVNGAYLFELSQNTQSNATAEVWHWQLALNLIELEIETTKTSQIYGKHSE